MLRCTRTRRRRRILGLLTLAFVIGLGVSLWFGVRWIADRFQVVLPLTDQCAAHVNGQTVSITVEQAGNASIIVAEAQRRQLAPRASSIALATAYQESGIRNLDHGDLDSLGLFQQRPSQDWGTPEQIMDPWYASGRFYEALVKIPGWHDADLNDIAQRIQISAYPEAYRKHVPNARLLASALTGETPASFGCVVGAGAVAQPEQVKVMLERAFENRVKIVSDGKTLNVQTDNPQILWSATQLTIANSAINGVSSAQIGEARWTRDGTRWQGIAGPATSATLEFN